MHRLKYTYYILIVWLLGFVSCNNETEFDNLPDDCHPIALKGIRAVIDNGGNTRAVPILVDSIGKYEFQSKDEIFFTKIQRTRHPIAGFIYDSVQYSCAIEGENTSWKRESPTTDIFWSDGSEPHTFIGYILPHEDNKTAAASGFDWHYDKDHNMYYGSLGDPTKTDKDTIDYTCDTLGIDREKWYDHEKLRKEDLLLTYSTEMQNEDAMAHIHFHHGLSSVRVVVTITGYSSTGIDPDAETKVTNLVLSDQPTMYKWNNNSYVTDSLTAQDQTILNSFWGGTAPAWNQKKPMKLWQPREFHGTGVSRTFTFYGIVTPGEQDSIAMNFSVSYPDPLVPSHRLNKTYAATLKLKNNKKVEFRPGYCTSISVNLNHKDEKMTVGAEYMSWQYDDSPDEGKLRKNSTYLSYTDRRKITIVGDEQATADDATWLYTTASNDTVDIYGNHGGITDPFLIKTADQLLSFAYEVSNGNDFVHKFVKLDADITMQPSKDVASDKRIPWIGVGDATHAFNGFFLGSGRYINSLYGEHFFHTVGDNAVIDKLNFENVIEVQGCGVVAHKNLGLICGCYIDGDVKETEAAAKYTGSIVGENQSFIIACAHVGNVSGKGTIGGLVGFNNGTVMACYHAGKIEGSSDIHATVGKRGDGNNGTNNSIMFSCYFDNNLIAHTPTLQPSKSGYPFSTSMMQSNAFVNSTSSFQYDSEGKYSGQGKDLKGSLLEVMELDASDRTAEQLMQDLVQQGITDKVNQVFGYHFSLNEALKAFRYWLNAMPVTETVQTNCHVFTPLQIQFLKQHYTAEHKFIYTPATYPKVQ